MANNIAANNEITSKLKRLRFGISKMVSEPEFVGTKNHASPKNQYKRMNSFRSKTKSESGKYLARKCSMIEKDSGDEQEDDTDEFIDDKN